MLGSMRLVWVFGCALLVALPGVAASAGADADEPGFETLSAADHPYLSHLPRPPAAIRLWAQLSAQGDAYFTLEKDVLPAPYTPVPMEGRDPLMSFAAFPHVTTGVEDGALMYAAREVRAAWDADFAEGHPVVVEWRLSTGVRGMDLHGPAPMLLVKTKLVAEDRNGFGRVLAERTVRAAVPDDSEGTVLPVVLRPTSGINAGDRLLVHLDWKWAELPATGIVRQPFVSVHPGSWIDLPLVEPVRVLELRERTVMGGLFVQAKVAHLFAIENVDLQNTNLLVQGPGVNVQGGRPLVKAPRDNVDGGHVATFDWRVPLKQARLGDGDYAFLLTAAQVGEDGPRVVAKRDMSVLASAIVADEPPLPSVLLVALVGLAATFGWATGRRR